MLPDLMFEIKVIRDGSDIAIETTWPGKNGLAACQNYADNHPGSKVIAWRQEQPKIVTGSIRIIETPPYPRRQLSKEE